eukprot:TRINITY_DN19041_c0_g1_i1.p1 TRINITY_DN19041_c0_g1~~TRINITY_DN19041_c0_g1_i1.p1  ORF type:complete len:599 (+),score=164.96 TRINITY_DN19041_c0_g1_i1:45-1799(+)
MGPGAAPCHPARGRRAQCMARGGVARWRVLRARRQCCALDAAASGREFLWWGDGAQKPEDLSSFIGAMHGRVLFRDGDIPDPPAERWTQEDAKLAHLLLRELCWRRPLWAPHTAGEEKLPTGTVLGLRKRGWHVGERTWSAAIRVHASLGHAEHAAATFGLMQRLGGHDNPSAWAFNALLGGYAAVGDIRGTEVVWKRMHATRVSHTSNSFGAVALCHAQRGEVQEAWDVLRRMHVVGLPPSGQVYLALLSVCGDAAGLRRALALAECDEVRLRSVHAACGLASVAAGALQRGGPRCVGAELRSAAAALRRQPHASCRVAEAQQWERTLRGCAADLAALREAAGAMRDVCGDDADPGTESTWLGALRSAAAGAAPAVGEAAFAGLQRPRSPLAWGLLLESYAARGDFAGASDVWHRMRGERVLPSRRAVGAYLAACGDRCGSGADAFVRAAEAAFSDALDAGLCDGDLWLWAMMMRVLCRAGDASRARGLERLRRELQAPRGGLYLRYFRQVSPGPTPRGTQRWEELDEGTPPAAPDDGGQASETELWSDAVARRSQLPLGRDDMRKRRWDRQRIAYQAVTTEW